MKAEGRQADKKDLRICRRWAGRTGCVVCCRISIFLRPPHVTGLCRKNLYGSLSQPTNLFNPAQSPLYAYVPRSSRFDVCVWVCLCAKTLDLFGQTEERKKYHYFVCGIMKIVIVIIINIYHSTEYYIAYACIRGRYPSGCCHFLLHISLALARSLNLSFPSLRLRQNTEKLSACWVWKSYNSFFSLFSAHKNENPYNFAHCALWTIQLGRLSEHARTHRLYYCNSKWPSWKLKLNLGWTSRFYAKCKFVVVAVDSFQ